MSKITETVETLNNAIAYLQDYEEIIQLNNCNTCGNKTCQYRPKLGERVRYNCPLYVEETTR